MTSDNRFFILTRKPDQPQHIKPGRICQISKSRTGSSPPSQKTVPVTVVGSLSPLTYHIAEASLEELSRAEAELLLALSDDAERLMFFRQRDRLRAASELSVGEAVLVERGEEQLRGLIRYIGSRTGLDRSSHPSGRFFGVELQVRSL